MAYSNKVIDHYENPRNVGSLPKDDANVGTGLVGAPECGDVMKLQVKVNPETGVIDDAKFKTFGCGSAIASSSLATEWLKGKTVDQALAIKNTDIVAELSAAAGEDSLFGAGRGRDQGGDRRLQEEAGGKTRACRRPLHAQPKSQPQSDQLSRGRGAARGRHRHDSDQRDRRAKISR